MRELLSRLREQHGVDLLVISDDAETRGLGTDALATPASPAEWLSPIVSVIPAQLFAYHATRARGLDTEQPRWISKVTLTR
jgi:glucosamine--fructose-6-phosphate aminotransferase (isomerizing)